MSPNLVFLASQSVHTFKLVLALCASLCYLLGATITISPFCLSSMFYIVQVSGFPAELLRHNQTLSRWKRDEDPGSVYGKGIAFFLGEPCETTCNRILFHVWCNSSTHRCECLPEYPVNVDNKYCLKAARIDEACEFSESCQYLTPRSECNLDTSVCKCQHGFNVKYEDTKETQCILSDVPLHIRVGNTSFDLLHNMQFLTISSLTLSFVLIVVLFCLVIKLINKNNQMLKNEHLSTACDRLPAPPPIMLGHEPVDYYPSLQSSTQSLRHLSLTEKPKYIPPLPHNLGSRRQSLSSLPSQSSMKSVSSVRSHHSYRNLYELNHLPPPGHCHMKSVRTRHDHMSQYRKASSPLEHTSYLANHLPASNHIRAKCSNARCGTNSRIKSEVCLVHTTNDDLHDELFVPNN